MSSSNGASSAGASNPDLAVKNLVKEFGKLAGIQVSLRAAEEQVILWQSKVNMGPNDAFTRAELQLELDHQRTKRDKHLQEFNDTIAHLSRLTQTVINKYSSESQGIAPVSSPGAPEASRDDSRVGKLENQIQFDKTKHTEFATNVRRELGHLQENVKSVHTSLKNLERRHVADITDVHNLLAKRATTASHDELERTLKRVQVTMEEITKTGVLDLPAQEIRNALKQVQFWPPGVNNQRLNLVDETISGLEDRLTKLEGGSSPSKEKSSAVAVPEDITKDLTTIYQRLERLDSILTSQMSLMPNSMRTQRPLTLLQVIEAEISKHAPGLVEDTVLRPMKRDIEELYRLRSIPTSGPEPRSVPVPEPRPGPEVKNDQVDLDDIEDRVIRVVEDQVATLGERLYSQLRFNLHKQVQKASAKAQLARPVKPPMPSLAPAPNGDANSDPQSLAPMVNYLKAAMTFTANQLQELQEFLHPFKDNVLSEGFPSRLRAGFNELVWAYSQQEAELESLRAHIEHLHYAILLASNPLAAQKRQEAQSDLAFAGQTGGNQTLNNMAVSSNPSDSRSDVASLTQNIPPLPPHQPRKAMDWELQARVDVLSEEVKRLRIELEKGRAQSDTKEGITKDWQDTSPPTADFHTPAVGHDTPGAAIYNGTAQPSSLGDGDQEMAGPSYEVMAIPQDIPSDR
ncbi:hypothetical protein BZG36_02005 [Bifiguratus adelaidae]|uniref:Uncharacterized protein n=1 Tax=Bifiguratus adelaidae TaxID=1938954 RepID=A0A261Y458_9FUNG|nr:hypothetical protein BZG36_02005 [Bifiguratus adelaidae]